jgi:ribosomal protein S18 acetylase RimI-like enzyme
LLDPGDPATWIGAWVAEAGGIIGGVGLAKGDYVDDLWLKREFRGQKIGGALLATLETQIAQQGFAAARLRVVGENVRAIRFYSKHGWQASARYPHELWAFEMVDMIKYFDR